MGFFNLFLLGIDSAFSLVEAPLSVIMDKSGVKTPKWLVCGIICIVCYLCSLLYSSDAGLSFLDVVDYYINFTLLLVGLFETFSAGWIFGIEEQIRKYGSLPVFTYICANFVSVLVASIIWFTVDSDSNVWGGFVALGLLYGIFVGITVFLLQSVEGGACLFEFAFGNVFYLADEMSKVVGVLPRVWAFLIKQFIPQILLILFINLAASKTDGGDSVFGHYGDYAGWPYQTIGIASVAFAFLIIIVGFIQPDLFATFDETSYGTIKALDYSKKGSEDESNDVVAYAEGVEKKKVDEEAPLDDNGDVEIEVDA